MKKSLLFLGALALLTACHNSPTPEPDPVTEKPNWTAVENSEYSSSMTLTCVPPEDEHWATGDELAALDGTVCIATATAIDSIFYLGIPGGESECPISISYYSATLKSIRTVSLTYYPNERLGSTDKPYVLNFSAESAAPERITLTGTILQPEDDSAPKRININDGLNTTYNQDNTKQLMQLFWREGDKVLLQGTSQNKKIEDKELTLSAGAGTATGTLSAYASSLPNEGTFYATYPVSTTASSEEVKFTIPSDQTYVADNIANDLLPMHGSVNYDETTRKYFFTLSPVAAVLCLRLQSSNSTAPVISAVDITTPDPSEGVAATYLSGNFSLTGSAITGGSGQTVTLDCSITSDQGVVLSSESAKLFHFVLPSVELPIGTIFTIHYKDQTDTTTKTTKKAITLAPGRYTRLAVLTL